MSSRHRAREIALQLLYRYDVGIQGEGRPLPESAQLANEISSHFQHFQVAPPLREFAGLLVAGTLQEHVRIDELIEKHATNWKVSRMGSIERGLLRLATYELGYVAETPASVVINEAIELAKQFGTEETPAFINGILDSIRAEVRPNEQRASEEKREEHKA